MAVTKSRFTIVTATAGAEKSHECFQSWHRLSGLHGQDAGVVVAQKLRLETQRIGSPDDLIIIAEAPDYLGVVPAFKLGVDLALQITAPDGVIACLHDDLLIEEANWDAKVMAFFNAHPDCGLLGFGGGTGLGADDIYTTPYNPYQLARQDFVSNMRDADHHGRRVTKATRVACLDGFSQIGRVEYWQGCKWLHHEPDGPFISGGYSWPLNTLVSHGVVHHAYDSYLGALANHRGWQVYMLPIACHHYGGQTAVGDAGYQLWADRHTVGTVMQDSREPTVRGDQKFWIQAHEKVYDLLRGVLPLRIR